MHPQERLSRSTTHRQQTVIAQDQRGMIADVGNQPLLFVEVQRHALVVVIANSVVELHRDLVQRKQTRRRSGHRTPGQRMGVQHTVCILAFAVNGAVDDKASRVHGVVRVADDSAVQVDPHQIRRGDLLEQQAIGVDEEVIVGTGQPHRDVGEDQVGHLEVRYQPIHRGQFSPQLRFGRLDRVDRPHQYPARCATSCWNAAVI
ncbi:Uncharacterised protein [Mycobacteroides abscessus subsp. abscessus]|nr:Uncharacterised protein [Mycobacteroides abscessus subsp. abscessus]